MASGRDAYRVHPDQIRCSGFVLCQAHTGVGVHAANASRTPVAQGCQSTSLMLVVLLARYVRALRVSYLDVTGSAGKRPSLHCCKRRVVVWQIFSTQQERSMPCAKKSKEKGREGRCQIVQVRRMCTIHCFSVLSLPHGAQRWMRSGSIFEESESRPRSSERMVQNLLIVYSTEDTVGRDLWLRF
jgi:hypothetical protein